MSDDERSSGDEPPTMSVPELAERVGVELSTAYRYLRKGQLPGVQVGSNWLIDRQRVERFMAGQEDAAGRVLIHAPPASDGPMLTLMPDRAPDTADLAMGWLRGAHAALALLLGAATDRVTSEPEERRAIGA
jgi:excisionase family DNA binding protein